MFGSITRLTFGLGLIASLLGGAVVVHAESLPLKVTGDGQVTDEYFAIDAELGAGFVQEYVAFGNSTLLGSYQMVGSTFFYDLDELGLPTQAVGQLTFTAADGATISGNYSGTSTLEGIVFRFDLDGVLSGGTDRLADVTGEGHGVVFQPDERLVDPDAGLPQFDVTVSGTWFLP